MFVTLSYHIINRAISDKIAISEEAFEEQLDYLRNTAIPHFRWTGHC